MPVTWTFFPLRRYRPVDGVGVFCDLEIFSSEFASARHYFFILVRMNFYRDSYLTMISFAFKLRREIEIREIFINFPVWTFLTRSLLWNILWIIKWIIPTYFLLFLPTYKITTVSRGSLIRSWGKSVTTGELDQWNCCRLRQALVILCSRRMLECGHLSSGFASVTWLEILESAFQLTLGLRNYFFI